MQNIVKTDRSRQSYVIAPPMTIFLGLVLAALLFFPNGEQALALSTQTEPAPMPINTLIELNSQDPTEMKSAIDFIESTGANVPLSFDLRMLFVQVPEGVDTSGWVGETGIVALYTDQAEIQSGDPHDQLAARVWNSWLVDHPFACCEKPSEESRRLLASLRAQEAKLNVTTSQSQPQALSQERQFNLTSSFYLGNHQIDLFLPESTGDAEDWDLERRDEAVIGAASGILWWIGTSQKRYAQPINLSYNVTIHDPFITPNDVRTQYEPIQTASQVTDSTTPDKPPAPPYREHDWIGELMKNVGHESAAEFGLPGHYLSMWRYINQRRHEMQRDFGFLIFIVDSKNDEDGAFAANGAFAYAGRPGPHIIMTYDNGANSRQIGTINGLKINMAHEMAHTIDSPEEYLVGCTADQIAGYFWVKNVNCENGGSTVEDSIMRSPNNQRATFPQLALSSAVRQMAGWLDSDGDGLFDPLDTTPMIKIAGIQVLDEAEKLYEFKGKAIDTPFHVSSERRSTRGRPPVTINTIESVEYQMGEGAWNSCESTDETGFDTEREDFSCQVVDPDDGTEQTVSFRARNSVGAYTEVISYPFADGNDNKAPSGALALVGGSYIVSDPTVHLALSTIDDGGVAQYRINYNGQWLGDWENRTFEGYKAFDLDPNAASHTLGVQYRDLNEVESEEIFIPEITLDMVAPVGNLQVSLPEDDIESSQAIMRMPASDDQLSRMNLYYGDRWHGWEPFARQRIVDIPDQSSRELRAQYQDAAGNISPVYTDFLPDLPTPTPTITDTPTPTDTPIPTNTPTPTDTPTSTNTPLPTNTPTLTPTETATEVPSSTPVPTATSTPTIEPSATAVPLASVTVVPPGGQTDLDVDGDKIPDSIECAEGIENLDVDEDGFNNCNDLDSDGDGLTDYLEFQLPTIFASQNNIPLDTDKDGTPDYLDADSDGDDTSDTEEAFGADVKFGGEDTDTNGVDDGLDTLHEQLITSEGCVEFKDTDGNGAPDFRDAGAGDGDSTICLRIAAPREALTFLPLISR